MTTADITTSAIIADITAAAAEWERQGGQRGLVAVDLHVISLDHDVTEEQVAAVAREAGIVLI